MDRRNFLGLGAGAVIGLALWQMGGSRADGAGFPFNLPDAEWKKRLSPQAYNVLRHQSTEYPNTSPLLKEHRKGNFLCAGCAQPLFSSTAKYDSGTGWPSFTVPLRQAVETARDLSLGGERTEVHCSRCGGHLGHVFDDGPAPRFKRYCMNGVAMRFQPA